MGLIETCGLLLLLSLSGVYAKKGELKVETLTPAEDCSAGKAANGDVIKAHYTGTLPKTGQVFDSSLVEGREPLSFTLGQKQVITGFEEGFIGMCVGEKRRMTIPPHLAYGAKGSPPAIPGGATLQFEVELIALEKSSSLPGLNFSAVGYILPVLAVAALVYFIYDRAQQEKASRKAAKGQKGAGSLRKRR